MIESESMMEEIGLKLRDSLFNFWFFFLCLSELVINSIELADYIIKLLCEYLCNYSQINHSLKAIKGDHTTPKEYFLLILCSWKYLPSGVLILSLFSKLH